VARHRSDQVFQLSLTEIAFTIVFILLLLLGYLVFKQQADRDAAVAALERARAMQREAGALDAARAKLRADLQAAGAAHPDDVITKLVEADDVRAERDRLKARVEDLDAKLSALIELRRALQDAAPGRGGAASAAEDALAFRHRVRQVLAGGPSASAPRQPVPMVEDDIAIDQRALAQVQRAFDDAGRWRAQQAADAAEAADAAASGPHAAHGIDGLRRDNADLRGQVAFLNGRLNARGGLDFPPCWADAQGKVEFLFAIELRPDQVVVTPAWPARRDADARALPGLAAVLGTPMTLAGFPSRMKPLQDWSRRHDPECRHYVQLRSTIADAVRSDRARLMVEDVFYKVEARR
jgi:hypothetical protein